MGIRQDQCNKVCRIIDDYLANRPRERDELIVAVRTVFKEADRKTEQTDCDTCKWGEWYRKGYDITMMSDECGGCCSWNNKWKPKDEPQTDCAWK